VQPIVFESHEQLLLAVDQYVESSVGMPLMGSFNVSRITDMLQLFDAFDRNPAMLYFNKDISAWDVS